MSRRSPGASSRVIAANLGCISSGLGAGGGEKTTHPCPLPVPGGSPAAPASPRRGKGGSDGGLGGRQAGEGGRRSPAPGGRAAPAPLRGLPGPGAGHARAAQLRAPCPPLLGLILV